MDKNQSRFWYIFFLFVGFIITIAVVNYFTKKDIMSAGAVEKFAATPLPPTLQQLDPEEVVQDLPRKSKLALYLTAFSDPSTYQCDTNYWCDAVKPSTKFFLLSDTTLPATLTPATGLPLTGIMLRGPSSYSLAPDAPHVLGSFTVAFYAKINSLSVLDQSQNAKIVLLDLPAESPHRVQLYIRPTYNADGTVDTTKAGVSCTFGDECHLDSNTNLWEFDRNTLLSTVNTPTLFALVFDKENKTMQFYAGISTTPQEPRAFVDNVVPDIRLGISEITVNKTKNWDANLVAMTFYSAALSLDDLRNMDKYLMQHSTGYSTMVRAKETLETEIQTLMSRLNSGEDTIRELLDKLNTANKSCSNISSSQLATNLRRWQISMQGNADISAEDLGKCSLLGVKSFGAKAEEVPPASTSQATSSNTNRKYKIPYPSDVSSSTPSVGIDTTVANPTKPTSGSKTTTSATSTTSSIAAPAAPASPSSPVDQNDPNGFWASFFNFLKNQQDKTNETEKTDLNKAYDQLRQEVNTDRTQPGSGIALQATVQDPPKKEEAAPVKENTSGFWGTIKSIFGDL